MEDELVETMDVGGCNCYFFSNLPLNWDGNMYEAL